MDANTDDIDASNDDTTTNSNDIDDTIGTRVANFYLSLRTIQTNIGTILIIIIIIIIITIIISRGYWCREWTIQE